MKKMIVVGLLFLLLFSLVGCGEQATPVDAEAAALTIMENVQFQEKPELVDSQVAAMLFGVDQSKWTKAFVYESSGATADEVAVFEAAGSEEAKELKAAVEKRVEAQKAAFENYVPEEMAKLSDPVIEQQGNVVVLCVCADNTGARDIVRQALQQ